MNSKIEVSRELAEKVDDVLYILTGEDGYRRLLQKYGTGWWGALTEMRAELRAPLATPVVEHQSHVIDLDARDWEAIQKAADESNWMPSEYMRNDWVADVCDFLKYGRAEHPATASNVDADDDNSAWEDTFGPDYEDDSEPVEVLAVLSTDQKEHGHYFTPDELIRFNRTYRKHPASSYTIELVALSCIAKLQATLASQANLISSLRADLVESYSIDGGQFGSRWRTPQKGILSAVSELLNDMLKDSDMPAHWFAQRIDACLDRIKELNQ